ncbi:MAG: HEAT repeat domain-containing protein [Candidatus Heimdallarchaeota archaeon]|nr:HEAT repeat domain-containing protein [Candidatus Heimdallarchaeota archaeon]
MSKSINTLTRQLRDLNPDTRAKAAMNLSEMGAEEAVPSMISAFKTDTDDTVRSVFAEALALFGNSKEVIEALIFAKNNDKSEKVRISSDWALGQITKARGYTNLEALLNNL